MGLAKTFNYYYYEMADPRVTDWLLMGDLWPTLLIIASYLYFVFQCGPRFMKDRPAYQLKTFIRLYNIFQVVANVYIVHEILAVYPDGTALRCDTGDFSWNPDAIRVAKAIHYIALLKIIDLTETVVFVLRKKNNQVSVLHLYHHISTILVGLILARYYSSGMAVFFPVLNGSVHVIMYSYYFLSSIEGIKEMVYAMKRFITIIQMVQLVILFLQACISLGPSCPVTKIPACVMMPNLLLNIYLFYNFYKKTYLDPKKVK
ncbi:elongation of very long chain fatty acids protein 4-like isoform X2 [Belonocnema kinseyi]|uniref:elongation of very long chain fatty acids protein 4-like isoform X2 n=1 Tax=Belonocnema kinseyi TaxID=2817044 RepID=UPI00143D3E6E|nr:elongation of very long chain fatty acids protein 4-like isoform X2 [Belonocnema kinseyi]